MILMGFTFHYDMVIPTSGYKAYNAWIRAIFNRMDDVLACARVYLERITCWRYRSEYPTCQSQGFGFGVGVRDSR